MGWYELVASIKEPSLKQQDSEKSPQLVACEHCKDADLIIMGTGEMYRMCAPNNWKSYECAAKQLATLKNPSVPSRKPQPALPV